MNALNIIFIKLGGSLITNKEKAYSLHKKNIQRVVKSLSNIIREKKDTLFIIGNGAGSYGHYAATIHDYRKPFGFAFVQQKVKELNSVIVEELLKNKIPAVSLPFSSISTAKSKELKSIYLDSLLGFLRSGITPVVYGDVVLDEELNTAIFSTEKIFSILCDKLGTSYKISKVIHLTTVDGFLDENKKVIPIINKKSYETIQKNLYKTKGVDVTGGMMLKVEESLKLANKGIDTHIINGEINNVLEAILLSKQLAGTTISSE